MLIQCGATLGSLKLLRLLLKFLQQVCEKKNLSRSGKNVSGFLAFLFGLRPK